MVSFGEPQLETELRTLLTGHEGGNAGHSQGVSYEFVAPALDPTRWNGERRDDVVYLLCKLRGDAVGVRKRKSLKIQSKSLAHEIDQELFESPN